MLFSTTSLLALAATALASPARRAETVCPAATTLEYAQRVVYAYAQTAPGATYAAFESIPFGVGGKSGACTTVIIPDGTGCQIPVGTTGNGVVQFGTETRQAFSQVTGQYETFPNGTSLIRTNVTLGVRNLVPVPFTFTGEVYLDFNSDCDIYAVRAYAQVPTKVLEQEFQLAGIPIAACTDLPV
ncbi:hypothetical protein BDY17DRAFT_309143 [Neohortaea acidophila]|uniref:Ubiquitin 3 binding protein But2 C-terminal domain-containing protein n=1 Tax=Neohortaea acidophila TaxID=245834 RepID=A0A6A6Q2F9_9PEZI|nr:uncharacterized protein BDY17DRAFT_309143 [Neohortaea acidophila]KAF2485853.1 hypothetical protein BDY17DRAFT_309143 [Neohortaea acidophila]